MTVLTADPKNLANKKYCYPYPRPSVTVDIVFFRRLSSGVEVLLIKRNKEPFEGCWALPGGFVDENESLEAAALRELNEETGIAGMELEQVAAFGDPGRDPRGHTISIAFGTVATDPNVNPVAADDAADARWFSIEELPALAFDHDKILSIALRHFRERLR
jgi:8-oxo-dGTP diphosphatase